MAFFIALGFGPRVLAWTTEVALYGSRFCVVPPSAGHRRLLALTANWTGIAALTVFWDTALESLIPGRPLLKFFAWNQDSSP